MITTSTASLDRHAEESDPVVRDRQTNKCFSTAQANPGPGVVQLVSPPIKSTFTMLGLPVVTSKLETSATDYWIAARVFDQAPDGSLTLVTRGVCRANLTVPENEDCSTFSLFGNAWRFEKDHKVVLELSQSDTPFLRRNNLPSTIAFPDVNLTIPTVPAKLKVDFRG